MRLSRSFLPTLKENPAEAQIVSHRLMLRAGLIRQTASGIYAWLPAGLKVLRNISQIVREEQDRVGAQEVLMPTLQSADLWKRSGRYDAYGPEMLRIQDRHKRELLYGPTNEEMITDLFGQTVKSYKDLPQVLYHIQWKFRDELRGVNSRAELAQAEAALQTRLRNKAMENGVTLVAPETVFLSADTQIESDALIEPNVFFGPGVTVQSGAVIRAFSHLEGCEVQANAIIGPYARIREGSTIGTSARVGNFVELKTTTLGEGSKANHLTYLGNAEIGSHTNIGAGTITCNYDGVFKHTTTIGDKAFIGSDSILVAPLSIGNNALVAAGSVITKNVPDEALAFGRAQQVNKAEMGRLFKERLQAKKENG